MLSNQGFFVCILSLVGCVVSKEPGERGWITRSDYKVRTRTSAGKTYVKLCCGGMGTVTDNIPGKIMWLETTLTKPNYSKAEQAQTGLVTSNYIERCDLKKAVNGKKSGTDCTLSAGGSRITVKPDGSNSQAL